MNLWRVVPLDRRARPRQRGGALWIPRAWQGTGRHDNPALYGCMYVSESPVSAVAEQLAPFRGTGALHDSMLSRLGRPLALAKLDAPNALMLLDFDDPSVLDGEGLRPSRVATGERTVTQAQAAAVFRNRGGSAGIRWWSTLESSWINATVFDRATGSLELESVSTLSEEEPVVQEAARLMGLV